MGTWPPATGPWTTYMNWNGTTQYYGGTSIIQDVYYYATPPAVARPGRPTFKTRGAASHSPPPIALDLSTAEPFPVDPPAPFIPRRTPRARVASRRQVRPVRSRPGARRAA